MEERDLNCSEEKSYYPIMADFATKVTKILNSTQQKEIVFVAFLFSLFPSLSLLFYKPMLKHVLISTSYSAFYYLCNLLFHLQWKIYEIKKFWNRLIVYCISIAISDKSLKLQ